MRRKQPHAENKATQVQPQQWYERFEATTDRTNHGRVHEPAIISLLDFLVMPIP